MTAQSKRRTSARQVGWAAVFLAILAGLLFPAILQSKATGHQITIFEQAGLILLATIIVQSLRQNGSRRPKWVHFRH